MKALSRLLSVLAAATVAVSTARAATTTLDFNTDPTGTGLFTLTGSAQWRPSGGASGGETDGYLSLHDAIGSQRGVMVFEDLEDGLIIKDFIFEVDLRIGGGHANPADGFSVNFASADDPVITGGAFAGTDEEANLPEEGTQTGLAIGFDTWQSAAIGGVQDVVGISVRVDNELLVQFPVPLEPGNEFLPSEPNPGSQGDAYVYDPVPYRNLPTDDPNYNLSMQTGARADVDGDGDVDDTDSTTPQPAWGTAGWENWVQHLAWEPFRAELSEGNVKIFWKGVELTPEGGLATGFTPRAGRIVFGGRTGGNWMATHVDNITLTTVPFTSAVVQTLRGNASGFVVEVIDQAGATLNPDSVELTLNGTPVDVTSIQKVGDVSYISHAAPTLLTSGTAYTVGIVFEDNFGVVTDTTREFTPAAYATIPAEFEVPASEVDTTGSGFLATMHQISVARAPGDGNSIANAERQLAETFVDPGTGAPYPNMVPAGTGPGGTYPVTVINFNQDPGGTDGDIGSFQDDSPAPMNVPDEPIPGIPAAAGEVSDPLAEGYNNWIVGEFVAYLDLPAGFHTLGVNSDDGFRVSTAREAGDVLGVTLGSFNGGKGSSDVLFDVYVPEAGIYPIRLLWWEGTGGANVEFFQVDPVTLEKVLINDRMVAAHVKAYPVTTPHLPHVEVVTPTSGQEWVFADQDIVAEIIDGEVPVDAGSINLTLNGVEQTIDVSKSGTTTTVTRDSTASNPLASGVNNIELTYTYTDGGNTVTVVDGWSFTVVPYAILPVANKVPEGSVDTASFGFKARTHQIDRSGDASQGNGDRFPGDGNRMPRPEIQLAEGYIDTATGLPFPNLTIPGGNPDGTHDVFLLNLNASGDSGIVTGDSFFPGLPGSGSSGDPNVAGPGYDNYVAEFVTYLELEAGAYIFGVNSDDGFVVSSAPNPRDTLGTVLGFFNGGRGNAGTLPLASAFGVVVPEDGIYPFRILYWQGGGGVNMEFVQMHSGNGAIGLVGDFVLPWTVPAYSTYTGTPRAWVEFSVSPTPWDNRTQQAGPGPILMYGRTPNSVDAGDIHNWQDTARPFADIEIGAVFANAGSQSIGMLLNGDVVTPTVTTDGDNTIVTYTPAEPLPSGSTNRVGLIYEGVTNYWTFVTQTYTEAPADQALPLTAADESNRGFRVKVHQAASSQPNNVASAEARLAGNPANVALPGPGPDGTYIDPDIINWNVQFNVDAGGNSTPIGNFQQNDLAGWPFTEYADEPIPGLPGTGLTGNARRENIAAEIFAWLEFPEAGYYKLGVNGDDGWAVTVAEPGVTDGHVLFTIDRGGGAADIPFSFTVPEPGLYPVRLVWYQGGGGGDLEFFSYGPDNVKIPINADDPNAIRAYYTAEGGTVDGPEITSATVSDGQITIEWTGGGTLEWATSVDGIWTSTGDSDGSFTEEATGPAKFYRVNTSL